MTDKWQLYSQTGVDGPEYGIRIRIRPGYTVVGFQKEDAKEIIGLRDDVERLRSSEVAMRELVDCMLRLVHSEVRSYDTLARLGQKAIGTVMDSWKEQRNEVERLRSLNPFNADVQLAIRIQDNRFVYSDAEGSAVLQNLLLAKDARIKELSALNESLMENGNDLRTRCLGGKRKADENKVLVDYIKKLEAAFLETYMKWIGQECAMVEHYCDEERAMERARVALEKLRAEPFHCNDCDPCKNCPENGEPECFMEHCDPCMTITSDGEECPKCCTEKARAVLEEIRGHDK